MSKPIPSCKPNSLLSSSFLALHVSVGKSQSIK